MDQQPYLSLNKLTVTKPRLTVVDIKANSLDD